ncbi:MAG TPA: hypothetical protein VN364_06035 [Bellilinea sp.]|nr:hypothetical protein [Bellilinea sp.]
MLGCIMTNGVWEIKEISLANSTVQLCVSANPNIHPQAGQYFLTFSPQMDEPLAVPLFFAGTSNTDWILSGQISTQWQPGTRLHWRGPLGHGFQLPPASRRVALVDWKTQAYSLPALVSLALAQDANVVWYSHRLPEWLPPSVEVLPLESLADAWDWADYLAIECDYKDIPQLVAALMTSSSRKPGCITEFLLRTSLTCGGMAECGVCAVRTKTGLKLACKDGPVFNTDQLELTV